ncbi:MAG: oxidoreductase, partial [Planctomycetaceae bacterium]|nr:oxidoreductase [Planctomycetaceae bacterium]
MIGSQAKPILNRRIRLGLLGCGRISRNHFRSLEELADDLELVGVCDTDPARMAQDFVPADARRFERLGDMLETAQPDVVAICTPSGFHPKQTVET